MRATQFVGGFAGLVLATTGALAADPSAMQGTDTWRASKLIGVPIYGPDTVSVGKIDDLLLGPDGRIVTIVVGVGGFLGLGEKEVALPFNAVTFSATPIAAPANPMVVAAPSDTTAVPTGAAGMAAPVATVPMAGTPGGAVPAAAPPVSSSAYPDHGTIVMNKDELKAMPTFQFAK